MIVKLKERVSKQEHCNLIAPVLAQPWEKIINDNKHSIDRVEVLSSNDCSDQIKKVILIESWADWLSLVLCQFIEVLTNEVQGRLHILEIMQAGLFTDYGKEKIDKMLITKHGNAGLDESIGIVHYLFFLHLV